MHVFSLYHHIILDDNVGLGQGLGQGYPLYHHITFDDDTGLGRDFGAGLTILTRSWALTLVQGGLFSVADVSSIFFVLNLS